MTLFFPVAACGNSSFSSCVVHPAQTASEKSICSIPPYSLAAVDIYLQSYNFPMVAASVVLHEVWSRTEKDLGSINCGKSRFASCR
uniref:Tobamovirus multiplication 1 n=1 Tax=Solanum tuberosum TaxID=4113 RepID=M1ASQ3_SOLTU